MTDVINFMLCEVNLSDDDLAAFYEKRPMLIDEGITNIRMNDIRPERPDISS